MRRRKLLTISHSYAVALNRRLASELARAGASEWDVTALAPKRFRGDLRVVDLERQDGERNALASVPAYFTRSPHLFWYGPSLRRALHSGWDCVHVWEEPYVVAGAEIAALTPAATPLVFATYQNIRKRYPPPFSQLERFVTHRASGWIAGGQTVGDTLRDHPGYRSRPFATIPLGVDVDRFKADGALRREARLRLGWDEAGPPVVGYLGRFVPEKGVSFLMSILDRTRAPWRALLVGGGSLQDEVQAWSARHGDRVRVVPAVTHDDVPLYLNCMDVLCAPSETLPRWREQLGRMILEAFACGVPVVASDSGEIPFTVADAGVVLRERDDAAWIASLEALLEAPERRRELGGRGRARATGHFAWSVVAKKTLDFLSSIAERGTPRSVVGSWQSPAPRRQDEAR